MHVLVASTSPRRVLIGGGVMNARADLFPLIRQLLVKSINGYLHADELSDGIDQYIVPPGLDAQSGSLGALAIAIDAAQKKQP